jgi:MFS family permease
MFSKKELKLLWPFYADHFLGTLLFILVPFRVIYFASIGFSASQIGILLAMWPLFSLLFEIPTGAIADLYGRKFSVMLGWFMAGTCVLLVPLSNNYYYLLLLFALQGIAQTFVSGAYDAWVVDLLRKKLKGFVHSYFTNMTILLNSAFVVSGIVGSLIVAKFGLASVWYFSGATLILTNIFLFFGEEVYEKKKFNFKKALLNAWNQTTVSVKYGYSHKVLFPLLMTMFLFGFMFSFYDFISWTPFLIGLKFPGYAFGYLWSGLALVAALSPFLGKLLIKKNNEKDVLIKVAITSLVWTIVFIFTNNLWMAVILALATSIFEGVEVPTWQAYFHKFIPTRMRATIGSVRGMLFSLAAVVSLPLVGFLVDKIGGKATIIIGSLIYIPVLILYLMIKEKNR